MEIALMLSGHTRTYRKVFRTFLDNWKGDIFISTWNNGGIDDYKPNQLRYVRDKTNYIVTESDLRHYYGERLKEVRIHEQGKVGEFDRIDRIKSMHFLINDCFNMVKDKNYDVFVRLRPDCYFKNVPDLNNFDYKANNLYCPVRERYGGINDQLFWGNKFVMNIACNYLDKMEEYRSQRINVNSPEMGLAHHILSNGVQIVPIEVQYHRLLSDL